MNGLQNMIESNELENQNKSEGAVIFAYNSGSIDYVAIAELNAKLIKKHLNIPTTLITDKPVDSTAFEFVIIVENNEINKRTFRWSEGTEEINWRNIGRYDVYDLSPYERTILLDADYIVNSNTLRSAIESESELVAFSDAYDVTGSNTFGVDAYLNFNSLDMYWATVIVFSRTEYVKQVFSLMKSVKENWDHYKNLYNFTHGMYRNDYSFTIAVNTLNGFTNNFNKMPWSLPSLSTQDSVQRIKNKYFVIQNKGFRGAEPINEIILWHNDLHIMNKKSLDIKMLEALL